MSVHRFPSVRNAPHVTATHEDGAVVLRVEAARPNPPDELRPIAVWAKEWGLEVSGLRRALERADAPIVRIGRAWCVRRSDVLAVADRLAAAPTATEDASADYAALVLRRSRTVPR